MAVNKAGRLSLICFLSGVGICCVPGLSWLGYIFQYIWEDLWHYLLLLYIVVFNGILCLRYVSDHNTFQVAIRSGLLGQCFGLGLLLSFSKTTLVHFGWYFTALAFFHWSEYFTTAVTNPRSLSIESFLLDHSREYKLAALCSWLEYITEWWLFPRMKQIGWLSILGLLIVIGGEILRKASMYTARTNFNHYIQHIKQDGHTLVTRGVYALFRHPSYVGWFYWSIGTQLMLCNPLCLIGYTIVSWRFFRERVYEEEIFLLNFFGEDYLEYQKQVGTGLPFITGYKGEL